MTHFDRKHGLRAIFAILIIFLCWHIPLGAAQTLTAAPVGRGIWIWKLSQAENGNVTAIINKLTAQGVQWVALKCGERTSFWPDQCTSALIARFHDAGIRVYGYQYVVGDDPIGEARVAHRILELGIDGFIIDAEAEYTGKSVSATIYMLSIRLDYPTSFIAYTTYAIISNHQRFPYVEFARYSDAVMPQAYWRANGTSPERMLDWMDAEWSYWGQVWRDTGHADAVKPIIPIGQGWNVSGQEIARFRDRAHTEGYTAVSLWVYHRMNRSMWEAYRNSFVDDLPSLP